MDNELFQYVGTQDFIEYGFEPEFIGRLPVRVVLRGIGCGRSVSNHEVFRGEHPPAVRARFPRLWDRNQFEDEALRLMQRPRRRRKRVPRFAHRLGETVPRLQILPGRLCLTQLRVSAELVREPKKVLDRLMVEGHKQEEAALEKSALAFAEEFHKAHGLKIVFDPRRSLAWSSGPMPSG